VDKHLVEMPMAYEELHFRNFLVHLLHKLNDEVHQLMFEHFFGMSVGDQERNIVSLSLSACLS
jgi:hypothetical protein